MSELLLDPSVGYVTTGISYNTASLVSRSLLGQSSKVGLFSGHPREARPDTTEAGDVTPNGFIKATGRTAQ